MSHSKTFRPVVIAMLKAPQPGLVKTRLAREVGAEPAVAIYRRLVEHQLSAVPAEWCMEVHFAPANAAAEMQQWLGSQYTYFPQLGDDLGERLIHAIAGAFDRGATVGIIIGGDCPGLDSTCMRDAWRALRSVDVVLGPALDGGYYLIGLRRPVPSLFRGIPWSSSTVLEATEQRIHEAGLSHVLLEAKEDVDDLATWRRLQAYLPPVIAKAAHSN